MEEELAFWAFETDDPKTYEEAMRSDDQEKWKAPMDEKIGTLTMMGTWDLKETPSDRKLIGSKWVFLKKKDEFGQVTHYKARLVAQGFSQKPGTDFSNNGTFAPVMRFDTLRTILAYSAVHNLKLRQFDVKSLSVNYGKSYEVI